MNQRAQIIGPEYPHLGSYLKAMRKDAGLSQQDAAEEMNITVQFVSKVESGKSQLPLNKIRPMAELYKIPIHTLIQAVEEEQLRIFNQKIKKIVFGT